MTLDAHPETLGLAFPNITMPTVVEFAFGADLSVHPGNWDFTDLSARLLSEPITTQRGSSSGASQAAASTSAVVLGNEDGALTPTHAGSQYWPLVALNTPGRMLIAPGYGDHLDTFARIVASGWGAADSGGPYTVVAPGTATSSVTGTRGRQVVSAAPDFVAQLAATVSADVDVHATCLLVEQAVDGDLEPTLILRWQPDGECLMARARINPTDQTIWAQLRYRAPGGFESVLTHTQTPYTHVAGTALHLRARAVGSGVDMKVWPAGVDEPPAWHAHAFDANINAVGRAGIRSGVAAGSAATPVTFDWANLHIVNLWSRATGYADDWQPTYLPDGTGTSWSQVRVNISGIRRRLGRGSSPAWSPIRRATAQYATAGNLLAYWPLEDGADAKTAENAVDDVRPMQVTGTGTGSVGFASYDPPAVTAYTRRWGTAPIASLADGGRLIGAVRAGTSSPTAWAVRCLAVLHAPTFGAQIKLLRLDLVGGTHRVMEVIAPPTGGIRLYGTDDDGIVTLLVTHPYTPVGLGQVQADAVQDGADVDVRIFLGTITPTVTVVNATIVGVTLGRVVKVTANPLSAITSAATVELARTFAIGHLQVWNIRDVPNSVDSATDPGTGADVSVWEAWSGESAEGRIARLCAAEGVPAIVTTPTDPTLCTRLGAQADASLLDLVADAATADGGMEHERDFSLAYLTRSARYNAPVSLLIDLAQYKVAAGDSPNVLTPAYDDQGLRNDQEFSRPGGSRARYEDTGHIEGSGGRPGAGRYDDAADINVQTDTQLLPHAAWAVHVGTVDEMRYPTMPIDLAANPELILDWLGCDIGARVQRSNAPAPHPPQVIDQSIDGYSETVGPSQWSVVANCCPYSPWQVTVLDDPALGKLDTDGSQLASGVTSSATTVTVTVTAGPGWTTDPDEVDPDVLGPLDVIVGGEVMRVTAITGSLPTYTFTVTRAVNGIGKAHSAGAAVAVHNAIVLAL